MNQRRYPRPEHFSARKLTKWQKVSQKIKEHEGLFILISVNVAVASLIISSWSTNNQLSAIREERAANFEANNYQKRLESMQDNMQAILEFGQATICIRSEMLLYVDPRTRSVDERRTCVERISEKSTAVQNEALKSLPLWSGETDIKINTFAMNSSKISMCASRVHIAMINEDYPIPEDDECGKEFEDKLLGLMGESLEVSKALEAELASTYPTSNVDRNLD